jgi:hypothetical protein
LLLNQRAECSFFYFQQQNGGLIKSQAGGIAEERRKVESFPRIKIICVLITFYPRAKLCLYLFLADNQHHHLTFVSVSEAGVQMGTRDDLIDMECRKNRQLL